MLKTLFKILILFGFLAYLIYAVTMLRKDEPSQECTGLNIVINDAPQAGFITENEVRQLLVNKKLFPEREPLDQIDLVQLESALLTSPYIDKVLCYKTAEGQISIQITPRQPVLHVLNQEGDDFYIDDQGATMPRGHHNVDLIVMTGNVPRATAGKRYHKLGDILRRDSFWNSQIQEIHVTAQGELQVTPTVGEHTIILGDTSCIQDKLSRLRTFYTEGLDKAGWNLYRTINLTFDNQIVCTKR